MKALETMSAEELIEQIEGMVEQLSEADLQYLYAFIFKKFDFVQMQ